ncbi:MAG: HAD hydrolase-like protein [Spirochaetes bacterium]|nr:HAD hydrolase-like protein [Spirochaetota bacterium]
MSKRAFLFDFDGTLVDTMDGFADIAGRVIHEFHPEMSFKDARANYMKTSGAPFFQQCEILFPGHPANTEKVKIFEEEKQDGFFKQRFSDDVKYAINALRERGDIAGVSSNNYQELIDKFVKREGLIFDVVLGFNNGFQKGKDHFEFVMKKFSLSNKELTFVGDSLKDAEKAFANKINFIGKCGTFKKEDFLSMNENIKTINNIRELLNL